MGSRISALAVLALAAAGCASSPPPAWTGPAVGVVVLHGEGEDPYGHTLRLTRMMQANGFLTDSPEMPWSARRAYDTGVAGMMRELDESVGRLRSRGAKKIFIAGESLGAAAAVRYATQRRVDGIVALSPAGAPEAVAVETKGGAELLDPAGPMNLQRNCAALRPGTPVLWVVAHGEKEGPKELDALGFKALPADPPAKYVQVPGRHLDTASEAAELSARWIREVAAR